jgi:UDP-N-acetylglucosamine 1-carboxyvinyltransferase
VSLPGGCSIGTRPIDLHLKGLEQLGAKFDLDGGYVAGRVTGRLRGATIVFPFTSVGATEQMLMAACLADGQTVLANAAREPEITDLAECLVRMGARITGIGTDKLVIEGVDRLHGAAHAIIPDRIETGSYACAAAISGGSVFLRDARLDHLGATVRTLREAGVEVLEQPGGLMVKRLNGLHGADAMTEPYPGFPTDMQAQFMALMSVAEGASMVTETIFENRFMHVPELQRMGASVALRGNTAVVQGVSKLYGASVMATDLRASASLVIAGLVAEDETEVRRVYHLDRGYERIEEKLSGLGANITRVKGAEA